jgi:organic hydroperoxide reductase OsmC/OhrA
VSTYRATIEWGLEGDFAAGRYSRAHSINFDGGVALAGSSSPSVVPVPYSVEAAVDPEEMFVASLSACHMLWFLDLARRAGLTVEAYRDEAEGVLAKDAEGRLAMTRVTLRPAVRLANELDHARLGALHHAAHEACFIANSVTTEVVVEPSGP